MKKQERALLFFVYFYFVLVYVVCIVESSVLWQVLEADAIAFAKLFLPLVTISPILFITPVLPFQMP